MSKQDRQGARTPADVQRRFDGSFAEMERAVKQLDSEISAELSLKIGSDESGKVIAMINASADTITIKGNRLTIESTNFELTQDGTVKAKAGEIGGCSIVDGVLKIKNANIGEKLTAEQIDATNLEVDVVKVKGLLNAEGKIEARQINANGIVAKDVDISGRITASEGSVGDWVLGTALIPFKKPDGTEGTYDGQSALYSGVQRYETASGYARIETWLTAKGVYLKVRTYESGTFDGVYYEEFHTDTQYHFKTWWQIIVYGGN